jgi:hypothetical protein
MSERKSCARRSDDTEARNDFVGCFGRSDRSAQQLVTAKQQFIAEPECRLE